LLHEEASWPRNIVDKGEDQEKIEVLRKELSTEKMVSFFKSADELASLVGPAVYKWETESRIETQTANHEIPSRYNPSELPKYPEKLKKFVTENRSDELRKALTYLEKKRILLISGVGGVGKSTLARALIDLRPINVPEPFWYSFYDNQDAKLGDILEKLAAYMNAPEIASFKAEKREPGEPDVDRLTRELHRRSEVWLIFDDLSMMLEDQHFAEKGTELLFSSLRFKTHNAKVIATSRILPILENGESLIDTDDDEEKQHLNGLRTNFAVDYLAINGLNKIEPEKLEELATGVDGHPLALKLLVELVKEYGASDILSDLSIYQEQKEDTIKKARKLFDKLAGDEKELLERISVYREPVSFKGLKEMFPENTPKNAVKKLIDKSLLETDHNGNYWLHPLVQEFSYKGLKNRKEVHLIAYDYYKSLNLPENPAKKEDLQPAIGAHHHACEAEECDLAARIIFSSDLHIYLMTWGDYTTLISLYRRLLPDDPLNDKALLSKEMKSFVFGDLGLTYQHLGYVRKAIGYYEQALRIDREIGHRHGEAIRLGNLGLAYRDLGEPKKAIEYYEQALKITREMGDRRNEVVWFGNLGLKYSYLGEKKKAVDYYEQALKIAREIGYRRGEGFQLGYLGVAYSDLGENKKAIEYYEQALKITREIGDRRNEGNQLGSMGNAYSDLGEKKKAIEHYEQALKIAREIDDRHNEGKLLGNLGLAYRDLGEPKKAIEFFKESLAIGKSIEDPRIINLCEQKLKELEEFKE
jgi:tetratricopeptide (TPR) repeat protein